MKTKQKRDSSFIILIIVVALLFVAVGVNGAVTMYLVRQDNEADDRQLATLIVNSATDMNQPLMRDASGRQYIPEAKLMLPAADASIGEVLYNYTPAINDLSEDLHVANQDKIRAAASSLLKAKPNTDDTFAATPKLQACARGVHITFSPQDSQTPAATKLLANGKTAYFYTEETCEDAAFLQYVQQIQSY